jgi:light-regulated signal transduction histidine kinase (bacteriophytochrome)
LGDQIVGRVWSFYDITERKRTEQDLQAAKEQIACHVQDLEKRVEERTAKLTEAVWSLEGVLYHISHDLRAPLRSMAGFAQLLAESREWAPDQEESGYVHRIVSGAMRMDRLIQDLLAYGRLSHRRINFSRVDLNQSVKRMLHKLALEIANRKAEIVVQNPLPAVWADQAVLEQIVEQLLQNALTFVRPNVTPHIRVSAETRDNIVRISIQDNGIGFDMAHRERIFRVFERLHQADQYSGTGMGLAIVRRGIERMGGAVGVESSPGEGSQFWLDLPGPPAKGRDWPGSSPERDC